MDIQIKRGLLDLCALAAIKDKDSYGYLMIKEMKPYIDISESTLYPILRRLEESGQISVYSEEHNGRLRKYYHVTDQGKERLKDFDREWNEICAVHQFITGRES